MADAGARGQAVSGRLVLVRHGQSHGNVDRRLDTRPPGAALTDLGRDQARAFARELMHPAAMIAHSVAVRAEQTAAEISSALGLDTHEFEGIHEVQVGDLEDRNDDDAIAEFETVYQRWHEGDLDVPMPGGETGNEVLDRYVPVLTQLRMRYLDDDAWHGDIVVVSHGAAIRLVSAVLAGVDSSFALDHHLANAESVVLSPITDGRWSCVQWSTLTPPFYPEPDVHPVEDALSSADPMG
jgi:broad specificity phosphatase PhoE